MTESINNIQLMEALYGSAHNLALTTYNGLELTIER